MQYKAAQQAIDGIFEKYDTGYFSNALSEFTTGEMEQKEFLEMVGRYCRDNQEIREEINDFFVTKLKRCKQLTSEEIRKANPELLQNELDDLLQGQTKRTKKAVADEKRAAKKAETEAKKAAKKAETEAKKAAKKAETEARKAAKKAETEAKKKPKSKPVLESFARDVEILQKTKKRVKKSQEVQEQEVQEQEVQEQEVQEQEVQEVQEQEVQEQEVQETPLTLKIPTEIYESSPSKSPEMPPPKSPAMPPSQSPHTPEMSPSQSPHTPEMPPPKTPTEHKAKFEPSSPPTLPKKTKAIKAAKERLKTNGNEDFVIEGSTLKDVRKNQIYFLREGKCFTQNKLVGKWTGKHIEFYNMQEEEMRSITFTDVKTGVSTKTVKCYIGPDCTLYLNDDGDILGKYNPEQHRIEKDEEETEEEYD